MHIKIKLLILALAASTSIVCAQDHDLPRSSVGLFFSGNPLLPSMSRLEVKMPIDSFLTFYSDDKIYGKAWYLVATPYLLPFGFFEIGAVLNYGFGRGPEHPFSVCLGTAFSMERSIVSVPLIIGLEGHIKILNAIAIKPATMILIYGEGLITQANFNFMIAPWNEGFRLIIGMTGSVGLSFVSKQFLASYGWSFGVSYPF